MNFFKKPTTIVILIIIIAGAIAGYFYFGRKSAPKYEFTEVERGDITQTVSVTGQVKPAESIDLAFDRSAKISQISVVVGDKVKAGQIIATLDNSEIRAQLTQAQAAYKASRPN